MTTVVLTPTHIAADHCKVIFNTAKEFVVDPDHRKIFVDPDKQFIFATEGAFDPTEFEKELPLEALRTVVKITHALYEDKPCEVDIPAVIDFFDTFTGKDCRSFIITKEKRIRIQKYDEEKKILIVGCADYAALGSGSNKVLGLLLSGMELEDVWETLHRIDVHTSVSHTTISLDVLEDYIP